MRASKHPALAFNRLKEKKEGSDKRRSSQNLDSSHLDVASFYWSAALLVFRHDGLNVLEETWL